MAGWHWYACLQPTTVIEHVEGEARSYPGMPHKRRSVTGEGTGALAGFGNPARVCWWREVQAAKKGGDVWLHDSMRPGSLLYL